MISKFLLILIFTSCLCFSSFSQSRSPAVENEIIIENEQGVQKAHRFPVSNEATSTLTVLALFGFLSMPFGIYLLIGKKNKVIAQEVSSTKAAVDHTPQQTGNVISISAFKDTKKDSESKSINDDDEDDTNQAA